MPAIFLWKERHMNAYDSLPTHGQGTGKIRVFARGHESRDPRAAHTRLASMCAAARVRRMRRQPKATV
jgi:hypothetical protein